MRKLAWHVQHFLTSARAADQAIQLHLTWLQEPATASAGHPVPLLPAVVGTPFALLLVDCADLCAGSCLILNVLQGVNAISFFAPQIFGGISAFSASTAGQL